MNIWIDASVAAARRRHRRFVVGSALCLVSAVALWYGLVMAITPILADWGLKWVK